MDRKKMKGVPLLPGLDRTPVAVANSLIRHFGGEPFHETLPELDQILSPGRKVALLLFDGMGTAILRKHPAGLFFLEHGLADLLSVLPSTTVAATTSLLTGKFPGETGWLGWTVYLPELGEALEPFTDRLVPGKRPLPEGKKDAMRRLRPTKSILEIFQEHGHKAMSLYPWDGARKGEQEPLSPGSLLRKASSLLQEEGPDFLYLYSTEPDGTMHGRGTGAKEVSLLLEEIASGVARLVRENPSYLFLVLSDHGQLDVAWEDLSKVPGLEDTLLVPPTLDARFLSFHVKEGREEEFRAKFLSSFGEDFLLLGKEEALPLFGPEGHYLRGSIGQFVALSKGNKALFSSRWDPEGGTMKGHHAGILEEEREITLSAFNLP